MSRFHHFFLFLPSDELASCLECDNLVGGLGDDSSPSGAVRRSLSAPRAPTLDPSSSLASVDVQLKHQCDLLARNGGDMYRYPSPLHTVAVQNPVLLQMLCHGGLCREEGAGLKTEYSSLPSSVSAVLFPLSSALPSQTPSHKQLDSYIYSLVQRRALPVRTTRPRTTISTEPSKSILRQASLYVKPVSGPSSGPGLGTLRRSELKPTWPAPQRHGASTECGPTWSHRQWTVESQPEDQQIPDVSPDMHMMNQGFRTNNSDSAQNQNCSSLTTTAASTATLKKHFRGLSSPKADSFSKDTKQPPCPQDQDVLFTSPPAVITQPTVPETSPNSLQTGPVETAERSVQEVASLSSSSQSQKEAEGEGNHMLNSKSLPVQRQNGKPCKGGNKNVKVKTITTRTSRLSKHRESKRRGDKSQNRSSSKRSQLPEEGSINIKGSKRAVGGRGGHGLSSSRIRCLPPSIPEGRVLDKPTTSVNRVWSGNHHHDGHHPHRAWDQVMVVAKPKYKRKDYWRLRAIMEDNEALKWVHQKQRKELLGRSAVHRYRPLQKNSPYAYVAGSDSEYSAECASLFHSTIMDTSEDERSNYTTNRFGDSESSVEEYVEESATTSDTEESGGGGAGTGGMGRGWSHLGAAGSRVTRQQLTPAQAKAFVKIKASHNLKKKILRFRSGSLKLMTTV